MISTRLLQRLLAEELLRRRRSDDQARYVEVLRRYAIDPNPHQLEAVAFALGRLRYGGALLCDEVGLGKTIEAALVISQLRAEHHARILIIVPVPLARQWQVELQDIFGIPSTIIGPQNFSLTRTADIVIVGREFASSPAWATRIIAFGPWDLIVIDEAHELLGSIYHRFSSKDGSYIDNPSAGKSRRAAWIKAIISQRPALLLTATPLQNNLHELWSLVHLVDPTETVLGKRHHFSEIFTRENGRAVNSDTEEELRERLGEVLHRTLRSQAQPFLRTPFTSRHCQTIDFHMAPAERDLYQALSGWISTAMAEYPPGQQRLLALILRRRMGSSVQALASTLTRIRLRTQRELDKLSALANAPEAAAPVDKNSLKQEIDSLKKELTKLLNLENLASHALQQPSAKLIHLWDFCERVKRGDQRGVSSDKLVIFTESLRTLRAIISFLRSMGMEGQVSEFSGQTETDAAARALALWEADVGQHIDPSQRPPRSVALRAAIIHEFQTNTRVLVATEAGAKGLNLHFCNCLVNFDLPWNPQRIEQRIGRVHRYGQRHDVLIVNFINLDNEGEARVYELLNRKLQLFEGVLGASDPVLGHICSRIDFERRLEELFLACRTEEERQREFDRLSLELDEEERRVHRTRVAGAERIISSLDDAVQERLRERRDTLSTEISQRDESLLSFLGYESPVRQVAVEGDRVVFAWNGRRFHLGPPSPSAECGEPLDLQHPVVQALISKVCSETDSGHFLLEREDGDWTVYRITIRGYETEDRVVVLGTGGLPALTAALACAGTVLRHSPGDPPEHPELPPYLAEVRETAERTQRARVRRLINLLSAKREDTRRWFDIRIQQVAKDLETAEVNRRRSRSPDELKKAEERCRRTARELARLRQERTERLLEVAQQLSKEELEIHRGSFVDVDAQYVFRVTGRGAVR